MLGNKGSDDKAQVIKRPNWRNSEADFSQAQTNDVSTTFALNMG